MEYGREGKGQIRVMRVKTASPILPLVNRLRASLRNAIDDVQRRQCLPSHAFPILRIQQLSPGKARVDFDAHFLGDGAEPRGEAGEGDDVVAFI